MTTQKTRKISIGAITAIALVGLALTVTTTGLLTATQQVYSTGTVDVTAVNVGVYSGAGCTLSLTSISWGTSHLETQSHKQSTSKTPATQR